MIKCFASKSTEEYKKRYASLLSNNCVLAIGGGKVIDEAKIYAKKHNKTCIAIPTTASGASMTSHAVIWKNGKNNIKVKRPLTLLPDFEIDLPQRTRLMTLYDVLSHIAEILWSKKKTNESVSYVECSLEILKKMMNDTQLVIAGCLAGYGIEITPTNLIHAVSYPLTANYNIPHGLACGLVFWPIVKFMGYEKTFFEDFKWYFFNILPNTKYTLNFIYPKFDIDLVVKEAFEYDKIHDAEKDITKKELKEILENVRWNAVFY